MEGLLDMPNGGSFALSFVSSAVPHPLSCGRTRWGLSVSSPKERGENKATRQCFCLG